HPGEQGLVRLQRREVLRLRRRLNVPRARVIAVDSFFQNDPLEPGHRLARDVEQLPRSCLAKTINQRGRIERETRQDLSAVARARAGADAVSLEYEHRRSRARQVSCRGQTRIAGADDNDVDSMGNNGPRGWAWG